MAQGLERIPLAVDSDYQTQPVRANFPEAAGTEFKVVAFEPDQAATPPAPAAMGAGDTLSALGRNVWDAVVYHTPAAVASAVEGDEPYKTWDWKDALIERARERSKLTSQPGDAQTKTVIPGMTKQDVNSLGPSLGFSVAGAGAGLGAGVPAGIAGSMVGTPAVGTVAGYTAGMAASGKAAYNMATNQFVRDLHDAANEEAIKTTGKPVSPEAFAARQAELSRVIRDYGLWEAIPEAAGNALGFGILTAPVKGTIGKLFGNNVATRFASKMGALYGGELATETVTQMGQHNAEVAAGMSKAPERSFTSPADWGESLREVAAPTILQTTLMAGGFKAGQMAKDRIFGKKDEAPPDDAIPAGDVGAGPGGGIEGEFIPAGQDPALVSQPGPGNTYDQTNPALPPGQPLLPRPALPAPEQGGPTDRQTTTAMGLLKHSPKASPELLQRLMRVDQTMATMLFNHWQGQTNGQVAGNEVAEIPAQGDQGPGADIAGSGVVDGFSDGAVSFTPDTAAEVAAPGGEPGMALGAAGPDAVTPLDVQAHAAATSLANNGSNDLVKPSGIGNPDLSGDSANTNASGMKAENSGSVVGVLVSRIGALNPSLGEGFVQRALVDFKRLGDGSAIGTTLQHINSLVKIPSQKSDGSINPDVLKAAGYSLATDAHLFGNAANAQALRSKGFDGLNVDDKAMVKRHMLSALNDGEIRKSVVELIPVDVMNMLVPGQLSANGGLDNKAMLLERLSTPGAFNDPVFVGRLSDAIAASLPVAFASSVTEKKAALGSGQPGRRNVELGGAGGAIDGSAHNDNISTESSDRDQSAKEIRSTPRKKATASSLLQAIVNRGGISREIMQDVGGDPAGRYMPGLFTKTGTTDLSALASYLFDEDGFHQIRQDSDIGPARELEDLITRALGGEKVLSTTAMEKGMQAEETAKFKEKAQRLGVKTVARKLEDIAADVLRIEAQNVLDEETRLEEELLPAYNETVDALHAAIGEDAAENFLEDLASKYQDETHLNYLRSATADIQEKINEQAISAAEKPAEAAGRAAEEGNGAGVASSGDRTAGEEARPALTLSSQSEAELAAAAKAAQTAEAQRLKDEQAAENKRQADAERGSFQLTGSTRPADVLAAQGQGGLFDAPTAEVGSPQEEYQSVIDDLSDAEIETLFKKAGLAGAKATVDQKRAMLRAENEADVFPLYEAMMDANEVPGGTSDRFDSEGAWDIEVANFPEPTRSVNANASAGPAISPEAAAGRLIEWKKEARRIGKEEDHSNEVIFSLFDATGEISKPWREAGYTVLQYDIKLGDDLLEFFPMSDILEVRESGMKVVGVIAQPPCTCFSSSGARWWSERHDKTDRDMVDKMFGYRASRYFSEPKEYTKALVSLVDMLIGETEPAFFVMENPVGRIATEMGLPKPTLIFDPHVYGNPYTKKTQLWGKFNPDLPTANVEPTQGSLMHKLWSRAEKDGGTRSITPEGFAYAFFMANHKQQAGAVVAQDQQRDKVAAKGSRANVVIRDVRDRDGNKLGDIIEPYDGTETGARKAAERASNRMWDDYQDASNIQSRIGATDENGRPKWAISPNFAHISPVDTAEGRATFGDEDAIREVYGKPTAADTIAGKPVADMSDDKLRTIARGLSPAFGEAAVDKAKVEINRRNAALREATAVRGEVGASLTKEERKAVMKTLVDVYKTKGAPKESKGLDQNGNERAGYAYSPELFEKSDITGAPIRYVVTLPDGRIAHPTELFPDMTLSKVEALILEQEGKERDKADQDKFRREQLERRKSDTINEANAKFNRANPGLGLEFVPALLTDGKQFIRSHPDTVANDLRLLGGDWSEKPIGEAVRSIQEPAAAHKVGDKVKLTKPGVNGRINIAGTVTKILPDGRLEVRTQQDGYMTVAESELGHKPKVGAGETAPTASIAGKPVSEMSDGMLNQIAKSSQPAAEKAKTEVAKRKKPKADPLAAVREFYTPGNIIHVDYWNQYDKVLEFKEGDLPGQWNVKVQQVKKDGDLWVPKDDRMEPPRWHATAPGKDKIVDRVAMPTEQDRDSFTLERLNGDAMEPVTFERGEYVRYTLSGKDQFGDIDGISHARREFSVDGLWYPFGFAYKAERPEPAKPKDSVPLSSVVEAVNKKHGEGLTDADSVPTQDQARRENPNIKTTLAEHDATVDRLRDGTATLAEYKAAFQRLQNSTEELTAEFAAMKKDDILKHMGGMAASRYKSDTKAQVVTMAVRDLMDDFSIGRGISYSMGGRDAYANAVRAQVERTTDADLAEYAEHVKSMRAAQTERVAQVKAAMKDPKTLDDFEVYLRAKMAEGDLTLGAARMTMTPEQRVAFDELAAEKSRAERKSRGDQQRTDIRVAATTTDGQVIETKHTKTGEPLFVVKAAERVERDVYNHWNATAKKLGGWYSSYRAAGAVPGFQFKTRENADAFLAFIGGNAEQAKEAVQTRRDAFEDDRSQTAVERLTEMADRLEERADESLNRDRKENTDRRARMAASAEAAANSDKSLAKTMRNIAQAIESGKTKFLDRVRQKAQVEMLRGFLHTAKANELRAKFPNYGDQEKHRSAPPTAETADYVDFPRYTAFRSDLATMGRQMLDIDGAKKTGAALLKVADDVSAAYLAFAKEHLHQVSTFKTSAGKGAVFASRDDAETAIKRSGFKGKAVVLPFKRGQNIIIMSPSAAKEAGIWKGDDDKRITLSPDFGEEVVAKVKEFSSHRISMPYLFESVRAERAKLKAIGIETPAELRSALREFMDLRAAPPEVDKIKQMERAMIGRKNDGLDFFPTPASVADELVQAAGIEEGMAVLEPSAGWGHIAERIRAAGVDPDVVEMGSDRRELLEAKGFRLVGSDFMDMSPRGFTYGDVFRAPDGTLGVMRGSGGLGSNRVGLDPLDANGNPEPRRMGWYDRDELMGVEKRAGNSGYDRIIMNPPFSDRRDAEHVQHAYTLLKPGGRLVAIMGEGVFFGQDKKAQTFRSWLEEVGGTSEKLEDGTFLDPSLPVNTGVNARMVVIEKGDGGGLESRRAPGPVDVESPEFKRWFGDSKIVGTDGQPLVLYHGTDKDFTVFRSGKRDGGIFLSPQPKFASDFVGHRTNIHQSGATVLPVYARAERVFDYENRQDIIRFDQAMRAQGMPPEKASMLAQDVATGNWDILEEDPRVRAYLKAQGFDGVWIKELGVKNLMVFNATQIKSTVSNTGEFSDTNPSILESRTSGEGQEQTASTRVVQGVVDKFLKQFAGATALNIRVVRTVADIPARFRPSPFAEGVFHDDAGLIYLIAMNLKHANGQINTGRAWQVLMHEAVGHFGLAQMMGDRFKGVLKEVMRAARASGVVKEDIYAPGHPDYATVEAVRLRYPGASDEEVAQEVLARMAETDPGRTLFGYVRAVVRQWLRDMARAAGITLDVTTAELNDLVAQASRYMRRGDGIAQGVDVDALGVADMAVGGMASKATGMESRAAPTNPQGPVWNAPDASRADDLIYTMQDKNVDLKRVQHGITKALGDIRDDVDAYLQEELFHGRAAKATEEFLERELQPFVGEMKQRGIDMDTLETFLWARHAKERNAQIAKINPDMPDGGSGLTDKQAADILAGKDVTTGGQTVKGVPQAKLRSLKDLAAKVDRMVAGNRILTETYELETPDTVAAWKGAYQHYVPLHREDADTPWAGNGTGQGYSVKGSSTKRATGSFRPVENILANLVLQRTRTITRGEKNRVAQALYGLAKESPNEGFWDTDNAPTIRTVENKAIYHVMDGKTEVANFTSMADAEKKARENPAWFMYQDWGDRVVEKIDPAFRSKPNVVWARFGGEDRFVIFNERDERAMRLAGSLKNLDADDISHLLGEVSRWTRYFASINTQYNPVFGVINLIRDTGTGLLNLKSTPLEGKQKEMLGNVWQALPAIYKAVRIDRQGGTPTGAWADLWEDFQEAGGKTGYRDMFKNSHEQHEALQMALDPTWWQSKWWGKALTVGGVLSVPEQLLADKIGKPVFEWLSDYNTMMENGIRLSAYKLALDQGMTRERAASLAKNLTVNFNKKGQVARQAGALYAFFNASVQGTARMAETLHHGAKPGELLGKAGKQIVYGGMLLGAMQAMLLMMAGYDDDEPPEFVRDRNIIIPAGGGKYLTVPLPLGFHVLPAIGRIGTEFVLGGFKKPGKHVAHIFDVLADSFNPIGNAGLSMQTLAPTVLDPAAALAENKDWTGKPIFRENMSGIDQKPGHARTKDTATGLSKGLAYVINAASGGTEFKPGLLSPTPDQIDYLIGQVTGGVGRETSKAFQTGSAAVTGEDLPTYKIPLVGRFFGDAKGQSAVSGRFYENLKTMNEHQAEFMGLAKSNRGKEAQEYARENPEAMMFREGDRLQRYISKLRDQKRMMMSKGEPREKIKAIDDQITKTMQGFNQRVDAKKNPQRGMSRAEAN